MHVCMHLYNFPLFNVSLVVVWCSWVCQTSNLSSSYRWLIQRFSSQMALHHTIYIIYLFALFCIYTRMHSVEIKAAEKLSKCSYLLVGTGAGMGCDSGLPDFRGKEGFWNSYPPYRNKFAFQQCANPEFLRTDPQLFWGFYGSRLLMYRQSQPHQGFRLLHKISQRMRGHFVVTSNVDGHTSRVFNPDSVYQVHGSIHHLQCSHCRYICENSFVPEMDYEAMASTNLPHCHLCQQVLRPNILMFDDWQWDNERSQGQSKRYQQFVKNVHCSQSQQHRLAIIEIGCGTAVPTIRNMCEQVYYQKKDSIYIRVNPDPQTASKYADSDRLFHIRLGALEAMRILAREAYNIE